MITYIALHFILLDLCLLALVGLSVYKKYKIKKALKAFGKESK